MARTSKNSRTASKTEVFYCKCEGVVKMITIATRGKMRHIARCSKCGKEARRPRELA